MINQYIDYIKMSQKMGGDRDQGDRDGGDHHSTGGMNGNPIDKIKETITRLEGQPEIMDQMRA